MKNIFKISVVSLFMFLTGCLDEILASLCEQLPSNNSIITQFTTSGSANYSGAFAKVIYNNVTNPGSPLIVSDCTDDFAFPKGEKKITGGGNDPLIVSFISILDDQKKSFFFDSLGQPLNDQYTVTVEWYLSQGCLGSPAEDETSSATTLNWQGAIDIPDEIGVLGECQISGESAIMNVSTF
jgi:hypothetical protein